MPDLRHIRTFTQLIRYLEDELGWPLDGYGVDDLTFVYEADELGLKPVDAAKVKKIRQLRPLDSKQPWGIFFIEFDRKKLPVVVLRRILSHLVVKKRASANKADRAAWSAEDLLFISAFGAEDEDGREITFAHFHQEDGDLPTLRVLGWDGGDTPLKFEHLEKTLKERLHWPDAKESLDAWRARWAGVFRHRVGHIINTSDMLAEAMAELAKRIRDAAKTLIDRETEKGPLRKLHEAFKTHLIHDLTEEGFADTYAQTITYGLLTAAISRTEMSEGKHGTALVASNVTDMVPVTNPFLKEMLQTFLQVGGRKGGIDFDELGVQDVVELLRSDETDIPAILHDFGKKTRGEDPVLHFYEHFLSAYNKQLKIQRGVFYTPQPVVSYIVRSVHELLQTEFGLEHGLADTTKWGEMIQKGNAGVPPASSSQSGQDARAPLKLPPLTDEPGCTETISSDEMFVQILDPATGTATFLVEVIDVIHNHLQSLWKKSGAAAMPSIPNSKSNIQNWSDFWNTYVPKALLPRLHAYELMMAPYAIAHMKIGLKLAETGYRFETEERARIYLTNALEEPDDKQAKLIGFDALAHEAAAVNEIKRNKRFTVVIGNPPYSGVSSNTGEWITRLIKDYHFVNGEPLGERNPKWLQDDYVKFIRFGQWQLSNSGVGLFSFITNHSYIDNPTFRGFRRNFATQFSNIAVLDLHGNSKKKESSPDGTSDENVFDIQQGVAIFTAWKSQGESQRIMHGDLFGARQTKYAQLLGMSYASTIWAEVASSEPYYLLVPQSEALRAEYEAGMRITDLTITNGWGVATRKDYLLVDFEDKDLRSRFNKILGGTAKDAYALGLKDNPHWKFSSVKDRLGNTKV
jgi:type I restriction-modification system DNA methylase subunit